MKVIFLDIDGVLNHEDWFEKVYEQLNDLGGKDNFDELSYFALEIDPEKVKLIQEIINKTGAEIVLSSSWRHMRNVNEILSRHNLSFIAKTPDFIEAECNDRGDEIQHWLDNNTVESFVILDDDRDMLESQKNNFINTDGLIGLTEEHVEQAIKILNNV